MIIDILCPLYNAEADFSNLINGINKQKNITINKIVFPVTESVDKTLELAKNVPNSVVIEIKKADFSHSYTREKCVIDYCTSDIVVFLTQDVILSNENALFELASCINGNIVHSFARQLTKTRGIEKYVRMKNYPAKSYIVSEKDILKLQIKAFYSSDACAAYDRNIFIQLNGFDGKRFQVSEDMYYCRKALLNGFSIKYCAEAVVTHSHNFSIKQQYDRYYNIGMFFAQNPEFQQYKSNGAGLTLAIYIFFHAIRSLDFKTLFRLIPDMMARYFGKKKGQKSLIR